MSRLLSERAKRLEKIYVMLEAVRSRIEYLREPVPEILSYLLTRGDLAGMTFIPECERLCKSGVPFDEAWKSSVKKSGYISPLTREDAEILISFGSVLGTTDADGQKGNIKLHEELLRTRISEAAEKSARYGKLYVNLGVCLGAAAALIII